MTAARNEAVTRKAPSENHRAARLALYSAVESPRTGRQPIDFDSLGFYRIRKRLFERAFWDIYL
jgi:hypothetical protein